jgi:hypothetical protein
MKRLPIIVGGSVFSIGVILEFALVATLPVGMADWFALGDHPLRFSVRIGMHLINAIFAAYLVRFATFNLALRRKKEREHLRQEEFLNHHVRNALSALQYAAYLTSDQRVMETCDSAIERIVWALSSVRHENQAGLNESLNESKDSLGPCAH